MPSLEDGAVDGVIGDNDFVRQKTQKRAWREVFDPLADDFHFGSGHNNFGDVSLQATTREWETGAGGTRQGAVEAIGVGLFLRVQNFKSVGARL